VSSSSRSSNSWTIKPQRRMHYDPSTCQEPLSITCTTSQQPNVRSNSTVTVSHTFDNSLQIYKTLTEITSRYYVQFYMTDIFIPSVLTHTDLQFHITTHLNSPCNWPISKLITLYVPFALQVITTKHYCCCD